LISQFPWAIYSAKLIKAIEKPLHAGTIKDEKEGYRLCIGEEKGQIRVSLLVRKEDGVIHDAKFKAFGETVLIGALEIICELMLQKNYAQAKRMGAELIEKSVEERHLKKGFPEGYASLINLALDVVDLALSQCEGLPMPEEFLVTPLDLSDLKKGEYPNWDTLTHEERIGIIQEVLAHEVVPYVQLDDGGVVIKELKNNLTLIIKYEGNCTSCISATGSTLSAIQQILRIRVHPQIEVIPEL
jgi:NifU-like protein